MEIVFLHSAEIDLFDSYRRFGESLHQKVERALDQLKLQPELGPVILVKFRRKLVLRSPFALYYTIEGRRIIVHALLDQRQDPDDILKRLN